MRKVATFLMIGCATLGYGMQATAAETWRWKDANGVVHYSDHSVPGAERVDIVAPKPSSSAPKPAVATPRTTAAASPDSNQPATVPYTHCAITAPANDETFNAVNAVTAGVSLEPVLQSGHRIEVLLNGSVVQDWPQESMGHTLKNLERGSYTISARVLDAGGALACSVPAVNFYVRQPTVQPQVQHR